MIAPFVNIIATHRVTLIIDLPPKSENVTVTALLKAKDADKHKDHNVQISGPFAEMDAKIADELTAAMNKIAGFNTNIAELDAQIDEAKKTKAAILKAEKEAAKPAAAGKEKPAAHEPTVVRKLDAKPVLAKPAVSTGSLTSPVAAGLKPAAPAAPAAPVAQDELGI